MHSDRIRGNLETLANQMTEGLKLGRGLRPGAIPEGISSILFCGMGGSGISGEILKTLAAARTRLVFELYQGGAIPGWADTPGTLLIFSSYSGGTAEILDVFRRFEKSKARKLVVTSGGPILGLALKKNIPCIRIPEGLPPRSAIGYLTFSLIGALRKRIPVSKAEMSETLRVFRRNVRPQAKALAARIRGRELRVYAYAAWGEPVIKRWCAQLAENAKTLSSGRLYPEMFHNEIEGWRFPEKLVKGGLALFLRDRQDPSWLSPKIACVKRLLKQRGTGSVEIKSASKTPLARLFSWLWLGDWLSYELALLHHVDPAMIESIEQVKKAGRRL